MSGPSQRHPAEIWGHRAVVGLGLALVAHAAFRLTIELGAKPMLAVAVAAVSGLALAALLWHRARRDNAAA